MLIAAALAAATLTLNDRSTVTLASPPVRLGDVATGDPGLAGVIIARLPRAAPGITLSRRAVAALIRRAVPGAVVAGVDRPGTISFRLRPVSPPAIATCQVTRLPIAAGAPITAKVVAAQPCGDRVAAGLVAYDPQRGEVIARRSIAAGVDLGVLRVPDAPAVRKGDELTLVSRAGPVVVERPVTALQPGRNGARLFVRDRAGHVSSIDFVGEKAS